MSNSLWSVTSYFWHIYTQISHFQEFCQKSVFARNPFLWDFHLFSKISFLTETQKYHPSNSLWSVTTYFWHIYTQISHFQEFCQKSVFARNAFLWDFHFFSKISFLTRLYPSRSIWTIITTFHITGILAFIIQLFSPVYLRKCQKGVAYMTLNYRRNAYQLPDLLQMWCRQPTSICSTVCCPHLSLFSTDSIFLNFRL